MCGIWGVLQPKGDPAGQAAMHAALAHRGPDGDGITRTDNAILGHRRLSIIDLSPAAAQPMWDVTRRACITYNGEIYNYRELRDECRANGQQFASESDTEVILNLYLRLGEGAFGRLNGMFAFALHDAAVNRSFLVRDRMGIKPLYYGQTKQGVYFASELRALLLSGAFPFDIDGEALAAYLQLDYVPSPMSMIRGVRKLPGGSRLCVDADGGTDVRPYKSSVTEPREAHGATATADVESFDILIHRVVERQLVADVPVGVFLSGGIDSSIIARAATDIAGRISTFSIAFDDPSFDERRWFDEVSRAIGSEHRTEILSAGTMLGLLPGIAAILGEPVADGSVFPTYLLSRFARSSVKVALSGDGADELFAGYPTHKVASLGRSLAVLPSAVRATLSRVVHALLPVSYTNLSLDFRIRKFLDGVNRDAIVQNQQWLGTFLSRELSDILVAHDREDARRLIDHFHQSSVDVPPEELLESLLRIDQRFYLQDQVLVKVDRASMAVSLEVRVPFLDDEMVGFARSLPANRKLRGWTSKWLLRSWAARSFSMEIAGRPKKGFGVPLGRWFRGELRPLVRDTLSETVIRDMGLFRPELVQKLIVEHESGARDHRKKIFNLLMFRLWYNEAKTWTAAAR